jgi:RNA polymerase sigma-70 factor (ECF subfamily)
MVGHAHRILAAAVSVDRMGQRDAAITALAEAVCARGFAIAADLLRDPAEAEDAVQEALARACAQFATLHDPEALRAWFYRVLVNQCLRTLRRRRLFTWWRSGVAHDDDDIDDAGATDLASVEPGADERLRRAREERRLVAAVGHLPPMQRTVVVLRFAHDLTVDQTAALLEIGAESVKTHQKRALTRLRAELER